MEITNFEEFCKKFNPVENALDQRDLIRWNGRDVGRKETLAEHTHLVVAAMMEFLNNTDRTMDHAKMIKLAFYHDAVEVLRGDILSITKREFPQIREIINNEEISFMAKTVGNITANDLLILKWCDVRACLAFIDREMKYRPNEFLHEMHDELSKELKERWYEIHNPGNGGLHQIGMFDKVPLHETNWQNEFQKGYADDAGVDIILNDDVEFLPMSTKTIDLGVKITPPEGEMALLFARTSAANKGLCVASCPVDPNYTGNVKAIVHNISNNIVQYKKGEAFCQYTLIDVHIDTGIPHRKTGKRGDGSLGSTGKDGGIK